MHCCSAGHAAGSYVLSVAGASQARLEIPYCVRMCHAMQDPVDSLVAAMVVSAFDVSEQKESELELQSLKNSLIR